MNTNANAEHVRSLVEKALSMILSDKYDAKITVKFEKLEEELADQ